MKKIDLVWPLGLHVTARNMKGVTIKDALDAIYKQFKKKVEQPSLLSDIRLSILTYLLLSPRLMTNWTSPFSLASSGTRKSAGHD